MRLYRLTIQAPPHNLPPRYNICPTDPVDVVTERDGNRDFVRMRWGLVPSWWPKPLKELKAGAFNARAETVAEKPARGENNFVVSCLQNPDDHSAIAYVTAEDIDEFVYHCPMCDAEIKHRGPHLLKAPLAPR